MASFNKVILAGNLTRDPELRTTQSGQSCVSFGIAVSEKYTTQSGEKREETCFVDITAWGKTGDTIAQYFEKGKPILVEGKLKLDQWQTQQGENRSKLTVTLTSFAFIGGNNDQGGQSSGSGNYPGPGQPAQSPPQPFSQQRQAPPPLAPPAPTQQNLPTDDVDDEDVPF